MVMDRNQKEYKEVDYFAFTSFSNFVDMHVEGLSSFSRSLNLGKGANQRFLFTNN